MKRINFKYYGEIRGKGRPRFRNCGKFVQTYTDAATRDYEMSLKEAYLSSVKDQQTDLVTFFDGEPLKLTLKIYQAVPKSTSQKKTREMLGALIRPTKKPDVDNILKSVCDSLNKVCWKDDTQIVVLEASKYYDEKNWMDITIETIPPQGEDELVLL